MMTGAGQEGKARAGFGSGGRAAVCKGICTCKSGSLSIALSSSQLLSGSPPPITTTRNIPSRTNPTKTRRGGDREMRKAGRERKRERGEAQRKQASIWETEFFISIHKEGGSRSSMLWLWSKTPPFLFLLSLNSVYCALVLVWLFSLLFSSSSTSLILAFPYL